MKPDYLTVPIERFSNKHAALSELAETLDYALQTGVSEGHPLMVRTVQRMRQLILGASPLCREYLNIAQEIADYWPVETDVPDKTNGHRALGYVRKEATKLLPPLPFGVDASYFMEDVPVQELPKAKRGRPGKPTACPYCGELQPSRLLALTHCAKSGASQIRANRIMQLAGALAPAGFGVDKAVAELRFAHCSATVRRDIYTLINRGMLVKQSLGRGKRSLYFLNKSTP